MDKKERKSREGQPGQQEGGGRPRASDRLAERRRTSSKASKGKGSLILRLLLLVVAVGALAGGAWWVKEQKIAGALVGLDGFEPPAALDKRFSELGDAEKHTIRQAAAIGEAIVPRLAAHYAGASDNARAGILFCMGELGSREAQDFLIKEVIEADPASDLAARAATNLGRISNSSVRLKLSSWAKSENPRLAQLAVQSVRAAPVKRREDLLEAIEPLRRSPHPDVQLAMLAASQTLDTDSDGLADYLADMLIDGSLEVSNAALTNLTTRLGDLRGLRNFSELRRDIRNRGVDHPQRHVQLNSRRILRSLGGEGILRTSVRDLSSGDAELVREAAISLLELGDNNVCPDLITTLAQATEVAAIHQVATTIGNLCKVSGRSIDADQLSTLREMATARDRTGAGACLALALFRDKVSLREIYETFVAAADEPHADIAHRALVEIAGQDLGTRTGGWGAWWARNERIFELRREVHELVDAAKAIGAEGDRNRYPEAKKLVEKAQGTLFELEKLEGLGEYQKLHQEIGSMLDGLHKHTVIDIIGDEDEDEDEDEDPDEDEGE